MPPRSTPETDDRLGYLLKHAHLRFAEMTAEALAPVGVDGRELAVLRAVLAADSASQQGIARHLGIDRTTMVGLVDGLEAKGIVTRRPDAHDRRRNVVELTARGRDVLRRGNAISDATAERFLSSLTRTDAVRLKRSLQALVAHRDE